MDAGLYPAGNFGKTLARQLRGPNLIFWSMVVASLALSIGSFYTTWIGMMEFVGSDFVGVLVSFIITFGVQSLLYAISWGIAQNLRVGRGRLIGSITMWLICAFISGFFSFYGFFNTQGGRDELTRRLHVNAEVQDVLGGVSDRMERRIDSLHAEMIDSPEYDDWMRGSIERVVADSRSLEAAISAAARAESERLRRQIQDNTLRIASIRDDEARTNLTLTSRDTNIANAQADIQQWERDIDRLNDRIADLNGERSALMAAQEQEARTGEGPRWRQLGIDLNTNAAAIAGAQEELAAKEQRLSERQADLAGLEALRDTGSVGQVISRFRLDIERLEEENTVLEANLAGLEQRRAFNADRETASVEITRRQFENKDYDQYATLVDGCLQLENVIKENRPPNASGIECRSPFVAQKLDELKRLQAETSAFQAACIDGLPVIEDQKIDPLIEFANDCLKYEVNGRDRAAAYGAMTALKSRRGDEANPISTAGVALFEDRQANAVMAALLAVFVDLLVLICAIIGRHSGQSERVRAIDLLFDRLRKVDEDGIEYLASMPENPNQREIVGELINMLVRENLADYHGHDGNTVALRPGARERLRHERARESGEIFPAHAAGHSAVPNSGAADGSQDQPANARKRVPRGKIRGT